MICSFIPSRDKRFFSFQKVFRLDLGPTQSLVQRVPGFFPVEEWAGREAEADVRSRWSCSCIAPYTLMTRTGQLYVLRARNTNN